MFLLKKILTALILPPTGPVLLALFGLWLSRRKNRRWQYGGFAMLLIFPIAGRLADRADHRILISCGIGFFALSFWLLSGADSHTGFWSIAWWIVISRIGLGLVMPALQMGALSHIEVSRLTQASGSFNFI